MKAKILLFITVAFCCFLTTCTSVFAQGTAFTYQGQLISSNSVANGKYDLTFKLWNASSGGSQVGSTITASGTVISNGLFTEILDFGTVFNGTTYWLELGVRTNGAASFTTLSPRQELTPTPYAITAENVDGLVPAGQLTGLLPPNVLSGLYGNPLNLNNPANIFNGNFTGNFTGNGSGLTGVALLAGGNTFTGNQNINGMLNINDGSGAEYFTDATIGPGGYFTGEQHSLNFDDGDGHIGSLIVGYDGANGYFNVGNLYTAGTHETNTTAFTVFGDGNVDIDPANLNAGFLNNGITSGSGLTFGSTSGEGIASQRTAGIDQFSLEFYTSFNNRMTILQNGFVGINTTNPQAPLHVIKTASSGQGDTYNGGPAILVDTMTGDGIFSGNSDANGYAFWGTATGTGGAVGVYGEYNGTGGGGGGVYGTSYATNTPGVYANGSGNTGVALTIANGALRVAGASTNSNTAAFIQYATSANTSSYITTINNTLCNGDPNAILIVTHNYSPSGISGLYETNPFSVWYNGSNWTIYHDNHTTSILGYAFNVLIIKN
jgi:hypothetical protein